MNKTSILALVVVPILLGSCIKAEQENTECDIETVSLHLDTPSDFFYHDYDTIQTVISTDTDIVFTVRSYASVQRIPTTLRVTAGATVYVVAEDETITPFLNGSLVDYSNDKVQRFLVVSENKVWSRRYCISVVHDVASEGNLSMNFENYYFLGGSGSLYRWNMEEWQSRLQDQQIFGKTFGLPIDASSWRRP